MRFSVVHTFLALSFFVAVVATSHAHQGPDPVAHWVFNSRTVTPGACQARLGPDLVLAETLQLATDREGQSLDLTSDQGVAAVTKRLAEDDPVLPTEALTVAAWVMIDEAEQRGVIAGAYGDAPTAAGDDEDKGVAAWVLGYNDHAFTFTVDSKRGGRAELESRIPYEKGQWAHVVAVYDGKAMQLYVNGQPAAATEQAAGPVKYPQNTRLALASHATGALRPLRGKLRDVSLYDLAARPAWVEHEFQHRSQLVKMTASARDDALAMVVEPYLQFGAKTGMTVMWQTTLPGASTVYYGETSECVESATSHAKGTIHEVRIEDLDPQTQYFYRVETKCDSGQTVASGVSTFSTAVNEGTPFAFVVISDTQKNPVVAAKLSQYAWAQRPNFLLHPGDLVDTGVNDSHWTQHFFPGMHELISRVPMYPVLGNHEQNAQNYYDYMSLPDPEYYYEFRYGDSHFLMIDTNRNVGPGSEQYEWLDEKLGDSKAIWKFVCHHHPPYSSDENDYGDLWKTNKSERGDLRARQLSKLYDKHGVDIVWNGHIHSYERTWAVRNQRAVAEGKGPIYMITGGGGGNLENPGPYRPFFQNQVRRGHHYVMVHINGGKLELRSYDLDDRLFDTTTLQKSVAE